MVVCVGGGSSLPFFHNLKKYFKKCKKLKCFFLFEIESIKFTNTVKQSN